MNQTPPKQLISKGKSLIQHNLTMFYSETILDRIGKDLLQYSEDKMLEQKRSSKRGGKSPRRRPRSPKRKRKNKGAIDCLSLSYLSTYPMYPGIEHMFLQQICDQKQSDLIKSRVQDCTYRRLSLNAYTYIYSLVSTPELYSYKLLNVKKSVLDISSNPESTTIFEQLSKQLFIQLRTKFVDFIKTNNYVSDLERQNPEMKLKHEQVIIYLKDYLKEFRPLTDIVISDMHSYTFRQRKPKVGKYSLNLFTSSVFIFRS